MMLVMNYIADIGTVFQQYSRRTDCWLQRRNWKTAQFFRWASDEIR